MPKPVVIILIIVAALFIIGNLWTYPLQHLFIFRPEKLSEDYQYKFSHPFEEIDLYTPRNGTINGILFRADSAKSKGVVLYFHGNADHCQRWGTLYPEFINRDYDFYIMDYRGFGKSKGRINQRKFYSDALFCYDFLRGSYEADQIVIYGRSMGTAAASYVASQVEADQLILETPFYSMKDLFYSYYPFLPRLFIFKFPFVNHRYLRKVDYPITIFHGTDDWVVPYSTSEKLKKVLKETDEFITIEGGSHSDLATYKVYQEKMDELLN